jgi:glycerophosphoryl diester phosphodiesterase
MKRTTLWDLGLPLHQPLIVGHRGACGYAPENTLPSLELAVAQSVDMIEFDVHLTRDGELLASHDPHLNRTAGFPFLIEQTESDFLRRFNVAAHFDTTYPETPMPRLEEAFDAIPASLPVNVELKCLHADHANYVEILKKKLHRERLLVSSFDWTLLKLTRARLPELAMSPLADRNANDLPEIAEELRATSAHCNYETITAPIVEKLRARDIPVLVYTVNEIEIAREMFAMGVSGVFTNFPADFIRHFRADDAALATTRRDS